MRTISQTAISWLVGVARDASKLKIDQRLMEISLTRITDVGKYVLVAEIKYGVSIFLTVKVPNRKGRERINFAACLASLCLPRDAFDFNNSIV